MKLPNHLTSALVVVAAIAALLYAYVDRDKVTDAERAQRQGSVFPAWRRENVTRVELSHGDETFALARTGDSFTLTRSVRGVTFPEERPDPPAVDKLLGLFEHAIVDRKVEGDPTGAPRVTGTILMGAVKYAFVLGAPSPRPEGSSYFRLEGEQPVVVSRDFTSELLLGADAYRDRTIVPYLSISVAKLEVRGKEHFEVERVDDRTFRVPELGSRASRERLDAVWSAFAELRAEAFLGDAEADRAVLPPVLTIVMTPKDPSKARGELVVGGECPGHPDDVVVVRKSPTRLAACAPKGIVPGLSVSAESLQDKRLFWARADEVEEIALFAPSRGDKLEIARKGSGWHERSPVDRDLGSDESDSANALAIALTRGEAVSIEREGKIAPDRAVIARATVRVGDRDETVELLAGEPSAVRRGADRAILAVPPALAKKLQPRETAIRKRSVWPRDARSVKAMTIACGGLVQELVRMDGAWVLGSPSGYRADASDVSALADAMVRMKADLWAADADDGTFGLAASTCSVTLVPDSADKPVKIVFGDDGEGGTYARLAEDARVFVAPKSARDRVGPILIDRRGFRLDPRSLSSLEIASSDKDAWVVPLREGGPDSGAASKAEAVTSALEALTADRVVHLGPPAAGEGFDRPSLEVRAQKDADAGHSTVHIVFGRETTIDGKSMLFAREDGTLATFAIAKDRVKALFERP